MEERNQLVLEAASMLERTHGVTNSTSAREMAQEGLGGISKYTFDNFWALSIIFGQFLSEQYRGGQKSGP